MHHNTFFVMKTNEIYEQITKQVIEGMKSAGSWEKCWNNPEPISLNGHHYQGINQLLLAFSHFKSPVWASFNQIRQNGGVVNKGEKGSFVVFTKTLSDVDADGNKKNFWMLKYYYVFNTDQCTFDQKGMEKIQKMSQFYSQYPDNLTAETLIENMPQKPVIEYKTSYSPCYSPALDTVKMPHKVQFKNSQAFYASLYHELIHSTGHELRLKRELLGYSADQHAYSKEELIAELGASFLYKITGNDYELAFTSSYIASWLTVLENNTSWVVWAASQASKAVNFILGRPLHTYAEQEESGNSSQQENELVDQC